MVSLGECHCQLVNFGLLGFRHVKSFNLHSAGVSDSLKVQVSDERPDAKAKKIGVNSCFAWEESSLLLAVHPRKNREIAYAEERLAETECSSQCATGIPDVHLVAHGSGLPLC
jgi:hypothetical protein